MGRIITLEDILSDKEGLMSFALHRTHLFDDFSSESEEPVYKVSGGLGEKIRTDGDCISRKAVLDLAEKGVLVSNGNYKSVCKAINELPSVEPKERTGEWIEDEEQHHVEKTWHCSECGNKAWGSYEKTTYCCQCGARMRKGEENG